MLNLPPAADIHGWLSLDRRGNFRLRGEPITHPGLLAYLAAHYQRDARGAWLVRNGSQRVFVALAYTPWVLRLQSDGGFVTHTGLPVQRPVAMHLDEDGNVLIASEHGLGLVDDRDLAPLLNRLQNLDGSALDDAAFAALAQGHLHGVVLPGQTALPVSLGVSGDFAARYGFIAEPAPGSG